MSGYIKITTSKQTVNNSVSFVIHKKKECEYDKYLGGYNTISKPGCKSFVHNPKNNINIDTCYVVTFYDNNDVELNYYFEINPNMFNHMNNKLYSILGNYLDQKEKFKVSGVLITPYVNGLCKTYYLLELIIDIDNKIDIAPICKYRGELSEKAVMNEIEDMKRISFYTKYDLSNLNVDRVVIKNPIHYSEKIRFCTLMLLMIIPIWFLLFE